MNGAATDSPYKLLFGNDNLSMFQTFKYSTEIHNVPHESNKTDLQNLNFRVQIKAKNIDYEISLLISVWNGIFQLENLCDMFIL